MTYDDAKRFKKRGIIMSYVTGNVIKELREKKGYTQKQLADRLGVSDKTISKWETGKGLPDVGIISYLAASLGVSLAELMAGEYSENSNRSGNMKKSVFYVCPVCGNVIQATGYGTYSCCGILLPKLEAEEGDLQHNMQVEVTDGEYYVTLKHEMGKNHYISFMAYSTSNDTQFIKMYPEQNAEGRFARRGHGILYAYCNVHGLFSLKI